MRRNVLTLSLVGLLGGCYVPPSDTPVEPYLLTEPTTRTRYWVYKPSYYTADRDWPLVVTLHGTNPWDTMRKQIYAWKGAAERHGLVVVAPYLRSTQGILPVVPSVWRRQLADDERAVLAVMEDVNSRLHIDLDSVLLTGFSAGGFPLYYVGLRHTRRFDCLVARACNSNMDVFEQIEFTEETRKLPILIFWGKDDLPPIRNQSWQAVRFLRKDRQCFKTERMEIAGGHIRRPEVAYQFWRRFLPERHRR